MTHRPRLIDWLSLIALVAMWGTAFLFNELALEAMSPSALVAGRIVIGAVVLLLLLHVIGGRLPSRLTEWKYLFLFALLGNVLPFNLIAWGQQHIDSGTTGILMAMMPLIVVTLAHFFVPGEKLTLARGVGFGTGFLGIVWMIGPETLLTLADADSNVWAQLAVLGGATSYGVNVIIARRKAITEPMMAASGSLVISSVLAVPLTLLDSSTLASSLEPIAVLAVLALGLFSTGIASVLYFKLVRDAGPTFLSLINYLIPVWAVLVGIAFLGESPEPRALAGLALVLAGVAISQWMPSLALPWPTALARLRRPATIATEER